MDLFGEIFTIRFLFVNLIFSVAATVLAALWCWYFDLPLAGRKIITFFVLTPLSAFVLLLAVEYAISLRPETAPKLRAKVDALLVDKIPDDYHKTGTSILAFVSIINSGSPSVAGAFRLRTSFPGSPGSIPFEMAPEVLPEKITVSPPNGNLFTVERSADLGEKVSLIPIGSGARVSGVLLFLAEGRQVPLMRQPGVQYDIVFEDCNDKVWQASYIYPAKSVKIPNH